MNPKSPQEHVESAGILMIRARWYERGMNQFWRLDHSLLWVHFWFHQRLVPTSHWPSCGTCQLPNGPKLSSDRHSKRNIVDENFSDVYFLTPHDNMQCLHMSSAIRVKLLFGKSNLSCQENGSYKILQAFSRHSCSTWASCRTSIRSLRCFSKVYFRTAPLFCNCWLWLSSETQLSLFLPLASLFPSFGCKGWERLASFLQLHSIESISPILSSFQL